MNFKHQQLLVFFWLALFTDCALIYLSETQPSYAQYRLFSKGILMPLLIVYFYRNVSSRKHPSSRLLVWLALLSAWIGDIFLLFPGNSNFFFGLIAFLAMHVIYSIYFYRMAPFKWKSFNNLIFVILAVVVANIVFAKLMGPYLAGYKIPVIVYIVVISTMLLFASNVFLNKRAGSLAANFFIPGALLFMASDTLLTYTKFYLEENNLYIPVMLTYGYAQQLMVQGFIKHLKEG